MTMPDGKYSVLRPRAEHDRLTTDDADADHDVNIHREFSSGVQGFTALAADSAVIGRAP